MVPHGVVVVCDLSASDCRFEWLAVLCCGVVLLAKALYPHVHSREPRVGGYLVGQGRLVWCVCLVSSAMEATGLYRLPMELSWFMDEQVLRPEGDCVKSGE